MSLPPNRNLFKEFPNDVFVETGTYRGDGIAAALEAGYKEMYSVDIIQENIDFCKQRFDQPNSILPIFYSCMDSGKYLNELLDIINPRHTITFWLDAHSQLFEGEPDNFPLLKELDHIGKHPVKSHTIIIDDILVLTHPDVTGWSRKMIEDAILKINPAYKIQYVANPIKNNILIAHV